MVILLFMLFFHFSIIFVYKIEILTKINVDIRIDAQVAIERAKSESQVEALYLQHRIREKELNELGRQVDNKMMI